MGMPMTIEIVDPNVTNAALESIFSYFQQIDGRFSPYQAMSELSLINAGKIKATDYSDDMKAVLGLAEKTKLETNGYFDIIHNGMIDPSGIVKGWAIWQASLQLKEQGFQNFYLDIGSDIEVSGHNTAGKPWRVGIRHPFKPAQIVKVLELSDYGVATSGTYERGQHIYNPHQPDYLTTEIVSLTVIGPNILEADRFTTAAFAMGKPGIALIEQRPGLEGYLIDTQGVATYTSGFERFTVKP